MGGAKKYSKLDLRSGYHQMPLRVEDRVKTTFWGANRMLWEWLIVPFGLKNAVFSTTYGPSTTGVSLLLVLHRRHRRLVIFFRGAHHSYSRSFSAVMRCSTQSTSGRVCFWSGFHRIFRKEPLTAAGQVSSSSRPSGANRHL